MLNHPDRLLPAQPLARDIARELLATVEDLPIISPHGHCDPSWFAYNDRFPDPAQLFVVPDHYVFRMLASQGISLAELGVNTLDNSHFQKILKKYGKNLVKIIICFGAPNLNLARLLIRKGFWNN